jgi:cell division protease FtsH
MAGADLANLINEAALIAVRDGDKHITNGHLEQARDRVLMGQKREGTVLSADEKERVAYHESGHALAAAILPNTDPLHKVSINPRGMALGVTMTLPEEDRYLLRESYIADELVKMLGGRMAEELVFGEVSSGAADDLARATEMAGKMVREWGMSDRFGPRAWRSSTGNIFLGDDMGRPREYSEEMAAVIDEEIERILLDADRRCRELLTDYRNGLDLVARQLLEHETIDGAEVNRLLKLSRPSAEATASAPELSQPVPVETSDLSSMVPPNADE